MAKNHGKRIVDEVGAMVHVLRAEGKTYLQIARAGHISKRSVCSILGEATFSYDDRIARVREERIRAWSEAVAARLDIDRDQLELIRWALDQALAGKDGPDLEPLRKLKAVGVDLKNMVRDAAVAQDKLLLLLGRATERVERSDTDLIKALRELQESDLALAGGLLELAKRDA